MFLVFFNKKYGVKAISVSPKPQLLTLKLDLMKRITVLLGFLVLLGLQVVFAQTKQITGTVTSAEDGMGIPGVSVVVKGTTIGATTDVDGKYTLSNVPQNAEFIVFSFVGLKTIEMPASQSIINVVMESDALQLEELVITGYGVKRKAAFTGAAQRVEAETVRAQTDANFMKSLQGSVAGMQMNVTTGQPGAHATVLIRGIGSINSGTQPLYVIDGVPISTGAFGMRSDEGTQVSPLSTLNSADIESISVLKDATATSIYGARAANGVIVIQTKQGKEGKTVVNFSAKGGVSVIPQRNEDYRMINRDEYIEFTAESLINEFDVKGASSYLGQYGFPSTVEGATAFMAAVGAIVDDETDTDWFKEVTRNGKTMEYNLDISGGNDKMKYYVSGGYFENEGIVISKDLTRYSGRVNIDATPTKFVKWGLNASGSYAEVNNGAGGGYFSDPITQAYMQLPTDPVKNPDGTWNMNTWNGYNPVAQRSYYGDRSYQQQYKAILSPYVSINLPFDLTFTSRAGLDFYDLREYGRWSYYQPQGADMGMLGEKGYNTRSLWTITNTLNWVKSFEQHNLNVLLGQEAQRAHDDEDYLAGSNFPSMYLFSVSAAAEPGSASTTQAEYSLASYFLNAEYDFADKYYFSASFRRDGSSRFGENNRWANFYSVGAKYRISSEEFMASTSNWLTNMTLRASYGTVGNQDIDWYASRYLYGFGYNYNGQPGMAATQLSNPDLKWEQTAKFNVGLDFSLFSRFSFEIDYYKHNTTDLIFGVPITLTSGLASVLQNIGELENRGFEFVANANIMDKTNFRWDMSFNLSTNENEIVELASDEPVISGYRIQKVGESLNSFYMREYAGVDPTTGSPTWWKYNEDGSREKTFNYNQATQRIVGDANPNFFGGFTNRFKIYDFDLGFTFTYTLGQDVYGSSLRYDEHVGNSAFSPTTRYVFENRWQKPGDITDVPRIILGGNNNAHQHSTRFLMDGSHIRLKTLSVGYNVPKRLLAKAHISGARLFFTADNVYTYTLNTVRALDPETGTDGILWWNYPVPRNFMFGVNLTF